MHKQEPLYIRQRLYLFDVRYKDIRPINLKFNKIFPMLNVTETIKI